MFLTVTPNAVLDKVIIIDEFVSGTPVRACNAVTGVGGKGLDVSVALRHLGQETTGLCCLAGQAGNELLALIERYGIIPQSVWVGGETRTAYIIAEQRRGQHTHIYTGGLTMTPQNKADLLERYCRLLPSACWVLTGGTMPPGLSDDFLCRLVSLAVQAGVPILVDSYRQPLCNCLPFCPTVVKMNQEEYGWTFNDQPASLDLLKEAARLTYLQNKMNSFVITCGADGLLAFTPQGYFHVSPPPQIVVNAAGAGDATSAALAWRLAAGDDWSTAIRWAAAAGAASVLTAGTSDLALEDVTRIMPEVVVKNL